ncbi:helix-turn-helix domain-containing protein [Fibrella aquatilis]|uniref:AraC family transcriptional regulator n=1 Tax=Fibrella aquatilis TaxID=2817059 RepID=A0A939G898_9BACT|nr:helix-turn-helix domain-containing protein [Fibrella aquatilis]MBO0931982.1 AraC family transcriptional regulator [Fibrella aquatilis]
MTSLIQHVTPDTFQQAYIRQPFGEGDSVNYFQIVRVEDVASRLLVPTLLHRTTYNYFVLLTNGQGRQLHNLDEITIGPGAMLLVHVDTITAIKQIDEDVRGFFVGFDSRFVQQLLTPVQMEQWYSLPACLPLSAVEQTWCVALCELLIQEKALPTNKPTGAARHLLAAFVSKLLDKAQDSSQDVNRQQIVTTQFKRLLNQHCYQQHGLPFYTDQLAISENYLFRCVKQTTGKSPKTLLLETLVLYAMVQLQDTTLDVSQIADALGITDVSYFGRLFRQHTHMTPTEYRRTARQDLS